MKLIDRFRKGQFVISSEVAPVKGCVIKDEAPSFLEEARKVTQWVHAVNVTDNQSAHMRLGSLAASVYLKQNGTEPVFQITCRDRNRIALQSDLLSACSLGIENVLCLTGDHIKLGDHREAKAVFDIDSVQLLAIADGLNKGHDLSGNPLSSPTDLCLGAVVNPNFEPLDLQLIKMEKKIKAGAQFFQTQAVYDPNIFEQFIKRVEQFRVPIQYGIVLIKSPEMAKYMNEHVSGVHIPDSFVQEIGSVQPAGRKKKAIEMAARLIDRIAPMVQGIHFMPIGWSDVIPDILAGVKLNTDGSMQGER